MHHSKVIEIFRASFVLCAVLPFGLHASVTSTGLRCEYLNNPLGIDVVSPRLSWVVESLDRGEKQTAWHILVASSPDLLADDKGDLWDSGKTEGDATTQITYKGKALASRARCFWKVRSWDKDGKSCGWSEPASWTIGLLEACDWSAKWIDASSRPAAQAASAVPVILDAFYETLDGKESIDVTAKLQGLARSEAFEVEVENESFGDDPAFNSVKHLRVEYEIAGKKTVRMFSERTVLKFPADLPPPPEITRAIYEAADGSGTLDVTKKLTRMAEPGSFSIAVENEALGSDPSRDHLKQLRVEFGSNGQSSVKIIPEKKSFHYPTDLTLPATVPYLRKSFAVAKPLARATIYATALGIYELRMNGRRVGDHILASEWTDYSKRLRYQEYDVTPLLKAGRNVLGAQVANGWWSGHIGNGGFQFWGKSPALYTQLELVYQDGSRERVVTDSTWKNHVSPLLSTDFMMGEDYDSTREVRGWDKPEFNDSDWAQVVERSEPVREMNGQVMEPVRELSRIAPKTLNQPKPGKWTYDMGQNMVGVVRLKVTAAAGTRFTLRHAEMLNPDGTIYTDNLRGAPSIDTYVCKGGGEEIWQPKFTFHGFRYVELTGLGDKPPMDAITGIVIGSDTPQTGEFACSDGRVNQLQSNIEWGQRGNYLSVPTDCPQRDERLGWMGDAQVFVKTATYNADVAAFFTKWLVDVTDSQDSEGRFADVSPYAGPSWGTPAWGDAGVICPWVIYVAYGDLNLLERQYPSMVRWVEWCKANSNNLLRGSDGNYGDWLSIGADTDKELIGTGYFAYSTRLLAKSAAALGKTADARKYEELFQSIKAVFNAKYVKSDGHIMGDTQCAYLMALRFELLPDELRGAVADLLDADIKAKDYHLSTGFVGVSYLLPELTKAGKVDTAYRLLMQDTFPSWLFSVKMGATTIWERWDGWTPDKGFQDIGMNSFNHYSLGSCGEWLYRSVAGIDSDPSSLGFKKIIIRPIPGGRLSEASGQFRSVHGLITSAWSSANGSFTLTTTIPANTTAVVHVPAKDATSVRESGNPASGAEGVTFLRMENGAAVFAVESGRYQFTTGNRPIPGTDTIQSKAGGAVKLPISSLLENDGMGCTFRSASPLSIRGASITVRDGSVLYQPQPGNTESDVFTYSIRNEKGGVATRSVNVEVSAEVSSARTSR